jgi:hypothetical protein
MFETPLLAWLGQNYQETSGYDPLFASSEPEIMGESWYLNARPKGIAFALTKKKAVEAIFLYDEGVEGFSRYPESLPGGMGFDATRAQVRAAFGEPGFAGEAGGTGLMAIEFGFDRFEQGAHYIRFEYWADDKGIRLITLGAV